MAPAAAVLVDTPQGPARVTTVRATGVRRPLATLVLGHGAGRGTDTPDLQTLALRLAADGVEVRLVDQPWVVAGRRVAPNPARLDEAWTAVVTALALRGPVLLGGRSAGARVACRTAGPLGATGVVALAFPLHPPGRPERSRAEELLGCPVPVLVVQGSGDAFGRPAELPAGPTVVAVPGADHSLYRGDVTAVGHPGWAAALDTVTSWVRTGNRRA